MIEKFQQKTVAPRSSRKLTEEQSKTRVKSDTKLLLTLLSYGDSALRSGVSRSAGGFRKITHRGQVYFALGTVDHVTRDYRVVQLQKLASVCPDCRRAFTTLATKTSLRCRAINRRCDCCKKPGVPVATRRKVVKPAPSGRSRPARGPSYLAAAFRRAGLRVPASALVAAVWRGAERRREENEIVRTYLEAMGMVTA